MAFSFPGLTLDSGSPQALQDFYNAPKQVGSFTTWNPNPTPSPTPSGGGAPSGGDSGGDSGGGNPVPSIDPLTAQIDEAFNAIMGGLDSAANNLRSALPGLEGDIRAQGNVSKQGVETERGISEQQIGAEEQKGANRKEDALTQARRLYNELTTGGQQRFGGASSAGEAFQALTGRELQRNFASIGQNYEEFMGQIAQAKFTVQERASQALREIDQQVTTSLNDARRDFQSKLSQIDLMKAEAAENKALRKLSALQEYRNQVFQVNLTKSQQQQYVTSLADQANQTISGYEQEANSQIGSAQTNQQDFSQGAGDTAQQFSKFGGTLDTGLQANAPTGTLQGPNTGVKNPWEEDKLFGGLSF